LSWQLLDDDDDDDDDDDIYLRPAGVHVKLASL